MRAVVDTNILVSGLLHGDSLPAQVLRGVATRQITPVVSHEVLAEYRAVLPRPRLKLRPEDIRELLDLIALTADWVDMLPYNGVPPLPGPADWPFIACALAADCAVATGNLRHFPAGIGVRVMTAREWVGFQAP